MVEPRRKRKLVRPNYRLNVFWLVVSAAAFVSLPATTPAAAQTASRAKPNVLFLLADDQRPDTIHALGNAAIKTPTLDALAARGISFRNAYNFGGNSPAVCQPSRNMLLSGRNFFRYSWLENPTTGAKFQPSADDPAAETKVKSKLAAGFRWSINAPGKGSNFPQAMKAAGYQTYHHGKRGNTAQAIQAQFEIDKYLKNDEAERRTGEPGREIVDDAIAFLADGRDKSRPFCMYLAFGNPHDPRVAASRYLAQYDRAKIPLPANYLPVHPFDNGELTVRDERLAPWPRTEDEIRKQLHEYYATITAFDDQLGRLMAKLRELGLEDDTIVVFSADQGLAVGSHGLMGKQNLYEHSAKSPLVFAGPGIPHGTKDKPLTSDALLYLFDIYPTICDLVGAEVPASDDAEFDGRSFRSVVAGEKKTHRDSIYCAYLGVQRVLRDERYKLFRYPQSHRVQLFDLADDPAETNDLSSAPEHQARLTAMLKRMEQERLRAGDWYPLSAKTAKDDAFDFSKLPK